MGSVEGPALGEEFAERDRVFEEEEEEFVSNF